MYFSNKIKKRRRLFVKTYFQTGNSLELKLAPVLTSRLDLRHSRLTSSQSTGVPFTFAIMLSMADTAIHASSSISETTAWTEVCLSFLDTPTPSSGDGFITSVAPDCICERCRSKVLSRNLGGTGPICGPTDNFLYQYVWSTITFDLLHRFFFFLMHDLPIYLYKTNE